MGGEAYHFYRCQSICLANLFPLLTPFHFKFVTRALCPTSAGLLNLLINVVISFQKLDALCLTNWQMVLYPQQIRTQALPELRRRQASVAKKVLNSTALTSLSVLKMDHGAIFPQFVNPCLARSLLCKFLEQLLINYNKFQTL